MPWDNSPRSGMGGQRIGRRIGQRRIYHNNNQHNRSGGGYHNNRDEFKFYPHTVCRHQNTTHYIVKEHIIQHTQKSYEQGFEVYKNFSILEKRYFNDTCSDLKNLWEMRHMNLSDKLKNMECKSYIKLELTNGWGEKQILRQSKGNPWFGIQLFLHGDEEQNKDYSNISLNR